MDNDSKSDLWSQWMLFPPTISDKALNFKKQIGLLPDNYSFYHRSKWEEPAGTINIFEAIIISIEERYKKGLYPNKYRYYIDIQTALQEFLNIYKVYYKIILEAFQNKTLLVITNEKSPKVVVTCERCKKYALINISCPSCCNVFYCDQSCLKANYIEHHKKCQDTIESIPKIPECLQVEVHSHSWNDTLELYYEHRMKFSLRMRGIKEFTSLKSKLQMNKLVMENNYSIRIYKNSLIVQPANSINADADLNEEEKQKNRILKKAKTITELKDDYTDNAKSPIMQEIKIKLFEMGGLLIDIIQERFPEKSTFIHIFMLP